MDGGHVSTVSRSCGMTSGKPAPLVHMFEEIY
jgi:hypothetical protein